MMMNSLTLVHVTHVHMDTSFLQNFSTSLHIRSMIEEFNTKLSDQNEMFPKIKLFFKGFSKICCLA